MNPVNVGILFIGKEGVFNFNICRNRPFSLTYSVLQKKSTEKKERIPSFSMAL